MKGSLRNSFQFQNVYQNGKSYANRLFIMYILENDLLENRVGMTVSKKVGNSVTRHRIQRLIRESLRIKKSMIKVGFDIVIIARTGAKGKTYLEIESAVIHLIKLHRLMNEEMKDDKIQFN